MMRKVLAGLCALGLVCSCSKDEAVAPDGALGGVSDEASVEVMFSGPRVDDAWSDSTGTATRATDATWTANDEVGLYMLPVSATTLADATGKNRRYRYSSGNFSAVDYPLYYPVNGSTVNFAAYYPYDASAVTNDNKITIDFTDQSTQSKKEKTDLCFHRSLGPYSKTAQAASMSFQHKFSKIRMTVNQGTSTINLTTLTGVTLKGMPDKAVVDLSELMSASNDTQIISALGITGTTDIAAYIDDATKTPTQAVVEAIVAPHTITAGKSIDFTIGSETKTYTFDAALALLPGRVYNFEFTLSGGVTPDPFPTYTEDGMTNCYMVAQNGEVSFKVSRAYEYDGTDFTNRLRVANSADYTGGFEAKVLWQDPSDLIESPTPTATAISGTGNTAIVKVKAKNNKSGNAVIGIYKTGTLVWSYHIWVTNYMDGGTGKTVSMANGPVFMDRNLGATAEGLTSTAYGLLYQWGRKDPFPGSVSGSAGWNAKDSFSGLGSAAATSKTTNAAAIIDAIQNPMTFLRYCRNSNNDWLPAGVDNTLWRSTNNKKTIYDPCPIGWRVPAYVSNSPSDANSPWKEYDDDFYSSNATTRAWSSTGWKFTRGGVYAYYPTAGSRYYDTGKNDHGNRYGYIRSATPAGDDAAHMHYRSDKVETNSNAPRSSGFSVRCVRE
jgi:hypothetical protein